MKTTRGSGAGGRRGAADFSEDLSVEPGQALTVLERELATLGQGEGSDLHRLEHLLTEARRAVRADAGTIFLRHGETLRFTVVQNESLARRLSEDELLRGFQGTPLPLKENSVAGYVALRGETLNVGDVYEIPAGRPFAFNPTFDVRHRYRTHSVLAVPIVGQGGELLGVLQVINAQDARGRVVAFDAQAELVIRQFAERIAAACPRPERLLEAAPSPEPAPVDPKPATEFSLERVEAAPSKAPREVPPRHFAPPDAPARLSRRLGELLLGAGLVSQRQLDEALAEQKGSHQKLGSILVQRGFLTERQMLEVLSQLYGIPTVDLLLVTPDAELLKLVPADVARKYCVLPVERHARSLHLAVPDPTDLSALDAIGFMTGLNVVPRLAALEEIQATIDRVYESSSPTKADVLDDLQSRVGHIEVVPGRDAKSSILDLSEAAVSASDTPTVRLVNTTLLDGIRRGASDIHLEPLEKSLRVRYRIDGRLVSAMTLPKRCEAPMVARLKILAELDIAQHRLPQDGRIKLLYNRRPIALRVSIVPMLFGQSISLRILEGAVLQPNLAQIGFDGAGHNEFVKAIQSPNGVILITGPTGSGKTTTLYSGIHLLSKQDLKIVTVEDPVEYALDGVNQVNVQEEIGRTFAATLRSFLRHDPDVILVGEMRDLETAQTAIRAGLTGHLVLSTLHTNDCASTIARLLDMSIPPFLLSTALRLLVAQRLVRRLCLECREPYEVDEESLVTHGHIVQGRGRCTIYRAKGCAACDFKGLRGRVGIFEVMPVTPDIADLILKGGTARDIRAAARERGMKTLREAGLHRVLEGVTTLEEVTQATSG
ncbi:MAG TPA: ATPase, T2SS/T4P/T4SS family [Methylomirabilota bacterium]|nr:ATPase, T2SS/T4P/T4SS family [Methylomirabilota bacterium]